MFHPCDLCMLVASFNCRILLYMGTTGPCFPTDYTSTLRWLCGGVISYFGLDLLHHISSNKCSGCLLVFGQGGNLSRGGYLRKYGVSGLFICVESNSVDEGNGLVLRNSQSFMVNFIGWTNSDNFSDVMIHHFVSVMCADRLSWKPQYCCSV